MKVQRDLASSYATIPIEDINVFAKAAALQAKALDKLLFLATVTGTSGNLVTIQRPGQGSADPQSYPRLASYSAPAAPDVVLVLQLGADCVVIGKVIK